MALYRLILFLVIPTHLILTQSASLIFSDPAFITEFPSCALECAIETRDFTVRPSPSFRPTYLQPNPLTLFSLALSKRRPDLPMQRLLPRRRGRLRACYLRFRRLRQNSATEQSRL